MEPVCMYRQEGGKPQAKAVASAEAMPCQRFQKSWFRALNLRRASPVINFRSQMCEKETESAGAPKVLFFEYNLLILSTFLNIKHVAQAPGQR